MGSDQARIGFDPTRAYRSVVAQQGRVTLEADVNEQARIAAEALRQETIDLVGPVGTPDDGYKVTTDGKDHLTVGVGTMYLGGWRLELDQPVHVAKQPEWLDQPAASPHADRWIVALHAMEQQVSAVEDQALIEVALGGPDTSARSRLMQHMVQIPTRGATCAEAAAAALKQFVVEGMHFNPKTYELEYLARLKVGFTGQKQPADPCCPSAQGGYLGADNQLVRAAVTQFSGGSGTLLWGWNNASFLYRATALDAATLQLAQAPIDDAHTPQPGQAIEILQTTAVLGNAADDNYVAAPQGLVVTLDAGKVYDPSTQKLTVPAGTTLPSDPNTLFVRLWQASVPFTAGKPVELDSVSGLTVTIEIKALPAAPLALRPFWNFAVRPNTPQQVYPARYLEKAQPPDGPRQWLCGLAIFTPGAPAGAVTPDCRVHFLPLTKLGACDCCAITLNASEDWQGKLNTALAGNSRALSICFQPGTFKATSKIAFNSKSVKITGAGLGTIILGEKLEAVLEFDSCPAVTITDVLVRAGISGFQAADNTVGLQGAVTFRDCAEIHVDRCAMVSANSDLRTASCLAVYNTAPADNPTGMAQETVVRIANSRFIVGNCQVGILLVNADHAVVEDNVVETIYELLGINAENLSSHPLLVAHLARHLVSGMAIVDTARKSKKAQRRLKRSQARLLAKAAHRTGAAVAPATNSESGQSTGSQNQPNAGTQPAETVKETAAPASTSTTPAASVSSAAPATAQAAKAQHINLGLLGRAHISTTFGTIQLKFISSAKLTNAWTDALAKAGIAETSALGAVHRAVKQIARNAVTRTGEVPLAFKNYMANLLPQLYSTSSQGIVVGGNVGADIRILNNTVEGTAQGIHVGLNNMRLNPSLTELQVRQLQIRGNSILVRVTPATVGDRHGIYVGGVASGLISENEIELVRTADAGLWVTGINVTHTLGPRMIIERNVLTGFTTGIAAGPGAGSLGKNTLRLAAENYSDAGNDIVGFTERENVP